MNTNKIKIGIIGLNPSAQWASRSHLPALRLLADEFEIFGVANSSYESSKKAAEAFDIPHAFQNTKELIQSPDVDLVVITVKVPYHFDLVKAALEAGKHVYCEHPLGNGLEETRKLAEIAATKNVVAVVGTQMLVAPEFIYLEKLLNEGYVGKVLSTTLIGSGGSWAGETVAADYYLSDKKNGATLLTIPLGHTLAGLTRALGGFETLQSSMTSNYPTVKLRDTGEVKPKTSEDQIMVIGTLKSGAAASVHYRGGVTRATNLLWEINGTEGDIQVTGLVGHGQLTQLTIRGAHGDEKELQTLTPPADWYKGLPDSPVVRNVLEIYKKIATDIRNNTRTAPTFQDAVVLHELLDSIERGAKG